MNVRPANPLRARRSPVAANAPRARVSWIREDPANGGAAPPAGEEAKSDADPAVILGIYPILKG